MQPLNTGTSMGLDQPVPSRPSESPRSVDVSITSASALSQSHPPPPSSCGKLRLRLHPPQHGFDGESPNMQNEVNGRTSRPTPSRWSASFRTGSGALGHRSCLESRWVHLTRGVHVQPWYPGCSNFISLPPVRPGIISPVLEKGWLTDSSHLPPYHPG